MYSMYSCLDMWVSYTHDKIHRHVYTHISIKHMCTRMWRWQCLETNQLCLFTFMYVFLVHMYVYMQFMAVCTIHIPIFEASVQYIYIYMRVCARNVNIHVRKNITTVSSILYTLQTNLVFVKIQKYLKSQ